MSDLVSFSPREIERLGLICSNCGTEMVIELQKANVRFPARCPSCQPPSHEIPLSMPQPPFAYGTGWNWLKEIRELAGSEEAPLVRFYFKEK